MAGVGQVCKGMAASLLADGLEFVPRKIRQPLLYADGDNARGDLLE
jgi:hypothetical protein